MAKFLSQTAVRIAVADGLGLLLPARKPAEWRKALESMLKLVEIEAGFTPEEMVTEWVEAFLDGAVRCPSLKEATPDVARAFDAFNGRSEYRTVNALYETGSGGKVILRLRPLYQHITTMLSAKLSQPDLAVLLGRVGFRKCSTFTGPKWKGEYLRLQRVWVAPAAKFPTVSLEERHYDQDSPRYDPEAGDATELVPRSRPSRRRLETLQ
jgi:hypothetical protein